MDKSKIIINQPQGVCTLQDIQNDVNAGKCYGQQALIFTWVTVQALINKIEELEEDNMYSKVDFSKP